jgi:hypothetical protein
MFASIAAPGVSGIARGTADVAAAGAAGAGQAAVQSGQTNGAFDPSGYFVDTMFRSPNPADAVRADFRTETIRILTRSIQDGKVVLSPDDRAYLADLVAARTGITRSEAEQRVDTFVNQISEAEQKLREAADVARKRGAQISIALALSMVIGAFIASAAAALGGRMRDEH